VNLKPIILEGLDQQEALEEASKQLQAPIAHLQTEKLGEKKFQISVFSTPGKISFRVNVDKMQVFLEELNPPQGAPLPFESEWSRALEELAKLKVTFGIDEKRFEQAVRNCLERRTTIRNIEIARGIRPTRGTDAAITTFFKLGSKLEDSNRSLETAMKGDVLLVKTKTRPGKPGTNVFNEKVSEKPGADISIVVGQNIEMRAVKIPSADPTEPIDAVEYIAKAYGKISFEKNKLEVASPVSLSEDQMLAQIDLISHSCRGTPLTYPQIQEVLTAAKVSVGILEDKLRAAIENLDPEDTDFKKVYAAKGIPPQNGSDGELELHTHQFPEMFSENISGFVMKGQKLAQILKPTKSIAGSDVTGKPVYGKDGKDCEVDVLEGIEVHRYEHSDSLIAEITGRALITSKFIKVLPVVDIHEDEMHATINFYPKMIDGSSVTKECVLSALSEAKVVFGIRTKTIENALKSMEANGEERLRVLIARGEPEVNGQDGRIEKLWTANPLNLPMPFVKKGEVLAVVYGPTKGKPGHSILGREIRAVDGIPFRITCEQGVQAEIEESENKTIFRATRTGHIVHEREDRLSVEWDLEISPDKMKVHGDLCRKTILGGALKADDIFEELRAQKIIFGHCEKSLREFIYQTQSLSTKHFLLAQGLEPKQGPAEHHKFSFSFNDLSEDSLEKASPYEVKERKTLEVVTKGETLIRFVHAGPGTPGSDVFGEKVPGIPGEKVKPILCGENVKFDEDRSAFISTLHPLGYVDYTNKKLSVFSPMVIAEDKLSASVSIYPPTRKTSGQFAKLLNLQDVTQWIVALEIKAEPDFSKFVDLCERVIQTKAPVLNERIVQGFTPQNGKDEEIEFLVKASKKPGRARADKTMDLRERDTIVNVKAGEEILTVSHATHGMGGADIFGKAIPPVDGKKVQFTAGENVQKLETETGYKLISKISGTLIVTKDTCSVIQTFVVDGDVNFAVGNIRNKEGGVVVRGSVLPDFSIFGSLDVIVEGVVENAKVSSDQRVVIMGSVLGPRTRVEAKGEIEVGVVNKAELISRSNVRIRSESYLARIKSDDSVLIESSYGRVAGGKVEALNKISLPQCGSSEFSVDTHLSVGKSFATEDAVNALMAEENIESNLKKLEGVAKILKEQGLHIKNQAAELNAESSKAFEKLCTDIERIDQAIHKLKARKAELLGSIKTNPEAVIEVNGKVYPGTHIAILNKTLFINTLLSRVRFRLDQKSEGIVVEPLTPGKDSPSSSGLR
jgi:uncharacterized protein (DUF342 family)